VRPLSLTIEGFTAFRDRQSIDFEPLDLFVITGPTGAGKTSILDAMVFALYGQVPRLGGKHGTTDLVSLGAAQARIELEFTITDKGRFRVARRLNRKSPQSATLERLDGDAWVSACERSGVRECDRVLTELIGLDYDSFCKAVVLPQGEFHRFLKGDPAERRQVLVSLLGVSYFQRMGAIARERHSDLSSKVERTEEILLDQYSNATAERVAEAKKAVVDAAEHSSALTGVLGEAQTRSGEAAEHGRLAEALGAGVAELEELGSASREKTAECRDSEAAKTETDASLKKTAGALKANRLHLSKAEEKLSTLQKELGTAQEIAIAFAAAQAVGTATEEELTGEAQLKDARDAEAAAKQRLNSSAQAEAKTEAALQQTLTAEKTTAVAREQATEQAQQLEQGTADAQRAAGELKLAGEQLGKANATAEKARAVAEKHRVARDRAAAHLEEHRRASAAGALAHDLNAGDPCPVCGVTLTAKVAVPADVADALASAIDAEQAARSNAETSGERAARAEAAVEAATEQLTAWQARQSDALDSYEDLATLERASGAARKLAAKADAEHTQAVRVRESAQRVRDEAHDLHLNEQGELKRCAGLCEAADAALKEIRKRKAAAAKTLDAHFRGQAPVDSEKQLDKQRARLDAAAETARLARSELDQSSQAHETARGAADAAGRRLTELDVELTRLRTRMESAAGSLSKLMDTKATVAAVPDAGKQRATTTERLASWCDAVAQTVGVATEVAANARNSAEQQILALASAREMQAPNAERALHQIRTAEREARDAATKAQSAAEEAERRASERVEMEERTKDEKEQIAILSSLALELRGDRFGEYIVLETLAILAARASEELLRISDGRYSLIPVEGDFQVVDHANADERRSVKTLSGGETFLASLALALALSRHVGDLATEGLGAKLEAVFIDEGFGTLDPETLDEVIDALDRLRADDLIVGVISHVPELAQRVRSGLEVRKEDGRSRILASVAA
jgi:DNA repair protein SbcC/Rad50